MEDAAISKWQEQHSAKTKREMLASLRTKLVDLCLIPSAASSASSAPQFVAGGAHTASLDKQEVELEAELAATKALEEAAQKARQYTEAGQAQKKAKAVGVALERVSARQSVCRGRAKHVSRLLEEVKDLLDRFKVSAALACESGSYELAEEDSQHCQLATQLYCMLLLLNKGPGCEAVPQVGSGWEGEVGISSAVEAEVLVSYGQWNADVIRFGPKGTETVESFGTWFHTQGRCCRVQAKDWN